jgi:hypothetical protein
MTVSERAVLMPVIENNMKQAITALGYEHVEISKLFRERYLQYGEYRRWSIEINEKGRPLFWDFAKRVGSTLGVGNNYLFTLIFTNSLLKQIDDWNLRDLLRGE